MITPRKIIVAHLDWLAKDGVTRPVISWCVARRLIPEQYCLLDGGAAPSVTVAIDARAPKFDGGIASRIDGVPFGIVVNRDGARFYDEGEDFGQNVCHMGRQPDPDCLCDY